MALLALLGIPIVMKMFAMPYAHLRHTASNKAQRVLSDFTQFLNQQLPQHEKDSEAITVKISARFPANVGPQGAEYRMQVEAVRERVQKIQDHWKEARRHIEDFFLEAGLSGVPDQVITRQIEHIQQRTESTIELVRQATRNRYVKTTAPAAFEELCRRLS